MGITVDMRPDAARDSIGARVLGITTPNSPASRAGVQVGDIVARFNGTPLAAGETRSEGEDQSRPAMRLINLASRLNPGDTVRLDLRRGTQALNVSLVAEESDVDEMLGHMGGIEDMMGNMRMRVGPMARAFAMMGGPLSSIELVRVNPGLGEYFGTSEGLLVVDVGEDTALGLRAGDVIMSIGGRHAASPPQAMRILGTYEPGEAVQLEVMRQKHRTTVSGHMPAQREHRWRIEPNNFDFEMFDAPADPLWHLREMPHPGWERIMPKLHMDLTHKLHLRTVST